MTELWDAIVLEAEDESPLWGECVLPTLERQPEPVFSQLGEERFALGLETIYEGYLLHYGTPRLFSPSDHDNALLLGDYLYAHGLVRIASFHEVGAVSDLAELISLCAQLRAGGIDGDGPAWAASGALLGRRQLAVARDALRIGGDPDPLLGLAYDAAGEDAVDRALAAHAVRVG
jgi:hypothetical protein